MIVSVIIINWNRGLDTCRAIESVLSQDYVPFEIIVVDNASTDDSLEIIQKNYKSIKLISLANNIGCPSGRNIGGRNAKGELLFFLDDDGYYIETDLISKTVKLFREKPHLGCAYYKVIDYNTLIPDAPLDRPRKYANTMFISSSFRGGASVMRRHVFEEAGSYPEDFFRQGEERYLSYAIYNLGYYILYFPKYTMCHKNAKYPNKNKVVTTYMLRNELLTAIRLFPMRYMVVHVIFKLINHYKYMYRFGAVDEYFKILTKIPGMIFKRNSAKILKTDKFRSVEALKYFHIDCPEELTKAGQQYSLKKIFSFKRNNIIKSANK